MHIGWPQGIYLALTLIGFGSAIAEHGKPKSGEHDAVVPTIASLIILTILYWGGFFA